MQVASDHQVPAGSVPALPPNAPRVPSNRLTRWLGRMVLRLGGWRMTGEFPDLPRLVRWKTGFWKIAKAADVPVLPVYFHYGRRQLVVAMPFKTGKDMDADMRRIRDWYRSVSKGKFHDA